MSEEWPLYYGDQLTLGNHGSNVGLCTLWTPKEKVLERVAKKNFAVAGQCYSRDEGLSWIARNLLTNKRINTLVMYGNDLNHSSEALNAFFQNGVDSDHHIIGANDVRLHREIPVESLDMLRKAVKLVDARSFRKDELGDYLSSLNQSSENWGTREQYKVVAPTSPETLPSEETGMVARGEYMGDVWLDVLDKIMTYGQVKKSQYGDDQRELVGLMSIITKEDPSDVKWRDFFQFTPKHLQEYLPQLMSGTPPEGVAYSYGSRLRDHNGIDQVAGMIEDLKETPFSRRALGSTWNVEQDHDNPRSPCLDLIQGLVQGRRMHFTAYIRSNDMFRAWPENAIGLRAVQYEIADAIGQKPGDLEILSNSAHIYSPNWDGALKVLEQNPGRKTYADPRGNFLISLDDNQIRVSHLAPDGKTIGEQKYASANKAIKGVSRRVSDTSHAMYLGSELVKAQRALTDGVPYVQDKD